MTVNNVNALLNFTTSQAAGQPDLASIKQEELTGSSFGQVMTKVGDTIKNLQMESASVVASAAQPAEPVDTAEAGTAKADAQVNNTDTTTKDDSGKTEDATQQSDNKAVENTDGKQEEAVEEVEKSAKDLVQQIADEMDVTPEEVEAAMAVLGLMPVELFDIDNLKQLMLTIAGSEDELTLVTDEALYDNMQNLFAAVDETLESLQDELGLDDEELRALLEQIVSETEETVAEEVPVQETETGPVEEMPEVNLEGMKDYTVSVQKDGETVQVKVTVDDASGAKSVQEEVTDAPKAEVQVSHKMRERDASADSGRGEGNAFLQAFDKPAEVTETPAPVSEGYQSAQTEDIMNQIMDYMRINLKADVQEMELQLHPASLGTVNVQIAAKDGAITAQFTTQNEVVRAVIETQLVQLKQQFEEQGIKVDAVEVTVANHEYGQQFSQENGDTAEKQGKSAKNTRRINLDEIDEEEDLEQMDESERIAVEMMQANGNTVDFTA
ncbi:MAG: flagellar hook-length control protein FliK [Lachnospiraceae bacterium]|nr:flagellar hook-length control protein FliK [Lachnospiraceae bacterium]